MPALPRIAVSGATAAIAAIAVLASATPASAHAIIELDGAPAVAGKKSVMTLEVQHGCLQNEVGIDKVTAYFSKHFRSVKAHPVDGWSTAVKESKKGIRVTWKLTGTRPAFNAPTFFPMTIGWPTKPGVYGLPVRQDCDGQINVWDTPGGPATADQPSPPLYPLPEVQVLPGASK